MRIRPLAAGDREDVRQTLRTCGGFTEEEVQVALDLLDEGLSGGGDPQYHLFAAEIDGRVRGYVCVGKTPLTLATWHLYWICVHGEAQGRGVGRALQAQAEAFVRACGGERLVLETSGRRDYARTRRFYHEGGYAVVGRIANFYRPGDDCVVFCKELRSEGAADA